MQRTIIYDLSSIQGALGMAGAPATHVPRRIRQGRGGASPPNQEPGGFMRILKAWGDRRSPSRSQGTGRGPAGRLAAAAVLCGFATAGPAVPADRIAVAVVNASEPALCAEKDNVTLTLASAAVRRFRIEAAHPAYIGGLDADRRDPDWTDCHDISAETSSTPPLRRVVVYENAEIRLIGYGYAQFWRRADVPVRADGRIEHGLNLVQLW